MLPGLPMLACDFDRGSRLTSVRLCWLLPPCVGCLQGVLAVLPSLRDLSLYRNTEVNSALLTKATVLSMVNLTALDLRETGISGETCVCDVHETVQAVG